MQEAMTEAAAMQHLRRVRARKEKAAGQPQFRVVFTARDYHWWETNYERLMSPTVRESRYVSGKQEPDQPPRPVNHLCMDCNEDISGMVNHRKRKRCPSCRDKFKVVSIRRYTQIQKAHRESLRPKVPRSCACGADISDLHGRAYRCKACSSLVRSKGAGALDDVGQTKGEKRP